MSWDWAGLLVVGGIGAALSATLAAAVQREAARLRVARAEIERLSPKLRRANERIGGDGRLRPPSCR